MKLANAYTLDRARWILGALLLVFAASGLGAEFIDQHLHGGAPVLSELLETGAIAMFGVVFAVGWNALGENRKQGMMVLAIAALCVALLDALHMMSVQGLFDVIAPGNPSRDKYLSLFARAVAAKSLLIVTLLRFDTSVNRRSATAALTLTVASVGAIASLVFRYPDLLPPMLITGQGPTTLYLIAEYAIATLNAVTVILLYRQLRTAMAAKEQAASESSTLHFNALIAAAVMALSALYFVASTTIGPAMNIFNVMAQLCMTIAALSLCRAALTIGLHTPYAAQGALLQQMEATSSGIDESKMRMTGIIENANDAIISTDESQNIILANAAAAAMFRTTVEQMQGKPLEHYLPQQEHSALGEHHSYQSNHEISLRMTGRRATDHAVIGVKSDGEEFPLEGSISSMMVNDDRIYTVILRDITERKQIQEQMAQSHKELSQFAIALNAVREEERKHIARDLHDDLGQLLAAMRMDLSLLQQQPVQTPRSEQLLASMDKLLVTSITSLRRIATDLRPRALDEGGLYFALESLRKEFIARHGIDCRLIANEAALALDDARSTAIFRIIQESLTNIVRHAQASKVTLKLDRHKEFLTICIQDDGRGIAHAELHKERSFGLVGMRERVRAMQGEISITGELGHGTLIEITIPL
jgi:PAS domain S-box-containing protein